MRWATARKVLFGGGMLSPSGWVVRAAIVLLAFGVVHASGWRDETTFISGTSSHEVAVRGAIYLLLYFGAVVIAPILLIAATIFAVLARPLWTTPRSNR